MLLINVSLLFASFILIVSLSVLMIISEMLVEFKLEVLVRRRRDISQNGLGFFEFAVVVIKNYVT